MRTKKIFKSDLRELVNIRKFIEETCLNEGVNEVEANKLKIATDEACSNIILHSYRKNKKKKYIFLYL